MFIKLTLLDGRPIWFNQAYVVTVEPRKGSGAIVVPLGDGLDYEVYESPDAIMEVMGGAVKPPVMASAGRAQAAKRQAVAAPAEEPDFRIDGGLIVPAPANVEPEADVKAASGKKKSTAAKSTKKAKPAAKKTSTAKTAASKARKKPALPPLPLTEDQLMRLQKMSPGSMRKLVNTLMSQFAVAEASLVVDALCAREIISVTDQGHVNWNWRNVEPVSGTN